jgi:hypothetical protein
VIGNELLLINAGITFLGLMLISRHDRHATDHHDLKVKHDVDVVKPIIP